MEEISQRNFETDIEHLKELITMMQSNIQFSINLSVGLIGLALVIAGWALSWLVKHRVDIKVENELPKIEKRVRDYSLSNPQFLWSKGTAKLTTSSLNEEGDFVTHNYHFMGLENFDKENLVYIDAYYLTDNVKSPITDYTLDYEEDGVTLSVFQEPTHNYFKPQRNVYVFVLWLNPVHLKERTDQGVI